VVSAVVSALEQAAVWAPQERALQASVAVLAPVAVAAAAVAWGFVLLALALPAPARRV
jgi:hypothetical protein